MKKKIIPLMVIGILVLTGLGAVAGPSYKEWNETNPYSLDDELDQYQTEMDDGIPVGNFEVSGMPRYNWTVAQSFIPTKYLFTRVELCISKSPLIQNTYPYVVVIRDSLTGDNLAITSVEPEYILEFPNFSWVEFDFDDIIVDAGSTYYIVSYTRNDTDNAYVWGVNGSDLYPDGQVYFSYDDGVSWTGDPPADTADMCFKTYGKDNQAPEAPTIIGETDGEAGVEYEYTFSAIDPNDDDVFYNIEWGDGEFEDWFGPYDSGEEVVVSHTWEEEGDYTIRAKAKDSYDAESDWGTLEVTMPVNQESDGLFGWVFLRGLVFNPGENESSINALAINLQYFEITLQGINKGVVRLKKVSFRNGIFIKMSERGLFGYTVYVSGFCHGGIEIQ